MKIQDNLANSRVAFATLEDLQSILCNEEFLNLFKLSKNEKQILELRWKYLNTFEELSVVLNISQERARQLYNRTKEKIENKLSKSVENYSSINGNLVNDENKTFLHSKMYLENIQNLDTKLVNVLKEKNINTLQELTQFSKSEIGNFKRFGNQSLQKLEGILKEYGLCFRS